MVKLYQFSYRNIKWNKSPCESNKILSSWSHTIHDLILTCSNDSNRLRYWYLFIINTTMDNNNTICFCSFQGIFYCFMILIVTKRAEFTVFNWQQFSFTGHGSIYRLLQVAQDSLFSRLHLNCPELCLKVGQISLALLKALMPRNQAWLGRI